MAARGLILAAPASGSGKTLVTAGLLRCLSRRGLKVAAAKAGPDFIDPTFHALASGADCRNLDPWAMREATLAAAVAGLGAEAEIVLCEGAMGLYDGTGADGETASTAELARAIGWPVVLVVDARGQGASVAALLRGFVGYRGGVSVVGVIFNWVSSPRHRALVETATRRELPGLALLGALPADPDLSLPARHLGLVPAAESGAAAAVVERTAAALEVHVDIDRLVRLARRSPLSAAAGPGIPPLGQRIAVARDDAFQFVYPSLVDDWRRAGAEIAHFSPLADEPPAPAADAVFLPGGYPELWAGRLAAAAACFAGLADAARAGRPVYGECGGYMVLGEGLIDAAGRRHPMAGLLPFVSSFAERRLSLGYREMRLAAGGPLGGTGAGFRGHEFHYATVVAEGPGEALWQARNAAGADLGNAGLRRGPVFGSFLHLIDRSDVAVD